MNACPKCGWTIQGSHHPLTCDLLRTPNRVITGIGSRKTPPEILALMTEIGAFCRENRIAVRSGHADGADWAFELGAQELCIAYLPWEGFNRHLTSPARFVVYEPTEETNRLVDSLHPAPERLTSGVRRLHGRNTYQILGKTLSVPSSMVFCWTPGAKVVGGTATAITLAHRHDIPVYNLFEVSRETVFQLLGSVATSSSPP